MMEEILLAQSSDCKNCERLKQQFEANRLSFCTTYENLKAKIISTDQLIRIHKAKINECEIQKKKLDESSCLIESLRRDCRRYEHDLSELLTQLEPFQKNIQNGLPDTIQKLQSQLDRAKEKLSGAEASQQQYVLKLNEAQLCEATLKREIGELKKAEKDLKKKIQTAEQETKSKVKQQERKFGTLLNHFFTFATFLDEKGLLKGKRKITFQQYDKKYKNAALGSDCSDNESAQEYEDGDDDDDENADRLEQLLADSSPVRCSGQQVESVLRDVATSPLPWRGLYSAEDALPEGAAPPVRFAGGAPLFRDVSCGPEVNHADQEEFLDHLLDVFFGKVNALSPFPNSPPEQKLPERTNLVKESYAEIETGMTSKRINKMLCEPEYCKSNETEAFTESESEINMHESDHTYSLASVSPRISEAQSQSSGDEEDRLPLNTWETATGEAKVAVSKQLDVCNDVAETPPAAAERGKTSNNISSLKTTTKSSPSNVSDDDRIPVLAVSSFIKECLPMLPSDLVDDSVNVSLTSDKVDTTNILGTSSLTSETINSQLPESSALPIGVQPLTSSPESRAILDNSSSDFSSCLPALERSSSDVVMSNDISVPSKANNVASKDGDVATGDGEVATEEGDVATEEGDVATEEGDVATEDGDDPTEEGDVATEDGDDPTVDGDDPTVDGDDPTVDGDEPTEKGNVATEDCNVATEDCNVATEDCNVATEDGNVATGDGNDFNLAFSDVNGTLEGVTVANVMSKDVNMASEDVNVVSEVANVTSKGINVAPNDVKLSVKVGNVVSEDVDVVSKDVVKLSFKDVVNLSFKDFNVASKDVAVTSKELQPSLDFPDSCNKDVKDEADPVSMAVLEFGSSSSCTESLSQSLPSLQDEENSKDNLLNFNDEGSLSSIPQFGSSLFDLDKSVSSEVVSGVVSSPTSPCRQPGEPCEELAVSEKVFGDVRPLQSTVDVIVDCDQTVRTSDLNTPRHWPPFSKPEVVTNFLNSVTDPLDKPDECAIDKSVCTVTDCSGAPQSSEIIFTSGENVTKENVDIVNEVDFTVALASLEKSRFLQSCDIPNDSAKILKYNIHSDLQPIASHGLVADDKEGTAGTTIVRNDIQVVLQEDISQCDFEEKYSKVDNGTVLQSKMRLKDKLDVILPPKQSQSNICSDMAPLVPKDIEFSDDLNTVVLLDDDQQLKQTQLEIRSDQDKASHSDALSAVIDSQEVSPQLPVIAVVTNGSKERDPLSVASTAKSAPMGRASRPRIPFFLKRLAPKRPSRGFTFIKRGKLRTVSDRLPSRCTLNSDLRIMASILSDKSADLTSVGSVPGAMFKSPKPVHSQPLAPPKKYLPCLTVSDDENKLPQLSRSPNDVYPELPPSSEEPPLDLIFAVDQIKTSEVLSLSPVPLWVTFPGNACPGLLPHSPDISTSLQSEPLLKMSCRSTILEDGIQIPEVSLSSPKVVHLTPALSAEKTSNQNALLDDEIKIPEGVSSSPKVVHFALAPSAEKTPSRCAYSDDEIKIPEGSSAFSKVVDLSPAPSVERTPLNVISVDDKPHIFAMPFRPPGNDRTEHAPSGSHSGLVATVTKPKKRKHGKKSRKQRDVATVTAEQLAMDVAKLAAIFERTILASRYAMPLTPLRCTGIISSETSTPTSVAVQSQSQESVVATTRDTAERKFKRRRKPTTDPDRQPGTSGVGEVAKFQKGAFVSASSPTMKRVSKQSVILTSSDDEIPLALLIKNKPAKMPVVVDDSKTDHLTSVIAVDGAGLARNVRGRAGVKRRHSGTVGLIDVATVRKRNNPTLVVPPVDPNVCATTKCDSTGRNSVADGPRRIRRPSSTTTNVEVDRVEHVAAAAADDVHVPRVPGNLFSFRELGERYSTVPTSCPFIDNIGMHLINLPAVGHPSVWSSLAQGLLGVLKPELIPVLCKQLVIWINQPPSLTSVVRRPQQIKTVAGGGLEEQAKCLRLLELLRPHAVAASLDEEMSCLLVESVTRSQMGVSEKSMLCRFYTTLCKQRQWAGRARIFCYDVIKCCHPHWGPLLIKILVAWPDLLSACTVDDPLFALLGYLVTDKRSVVIFNCRSELIKIWNFLGCLGSHLNLDQLTTLLLNKLKSGSDHAVFEARKSLEILGIVEPWSWVSSNIVSKHLWPMMKRLPGTELLPNSSIANGFLLFACLVKHRSIEQPDTAVVVIKSMIASLSQDPAFSESYAPCIEDALVQAVLMLLHPDNQTAKDALLRCISTRRHRLSSDTNQLLALCNIG